MGRVPEESVWSWLPSASLLTLVEGAEAGEKGDPSSGERAGGRKGNTGLLTIQNLLPRRPFDPLKPQLLP